MATWQPFVACVPALLGTHKYFPSSEPGSLEGAVGVNSFPGEVSPGPLQNGPVSESALGSFQNGQLSFPCQKGEEISSPWLLMVKPRSASCVATGDALSCASACSPLPSSRTLQSLCWGSRPGPRFRAGAAVHALTTLLGPRKSLLFNLSLFFWKGL